MSNSDSQREIIEGSTTMISGISGGVVSYLPGDIVDRDYQLTKLIGRGGMGAVFACRHLTLDKEYALKLLSASDLTSEAWSRFQIEAKTLARLNHPGIVRIHNMGVDKEQCPYYVMDLLEGNALDLLVKENGPLPVNMALELFIQAADALASAHSQGIVHRDVKPSNIMRINAAGAEAGKSKLVDFGIARLPKHAAAAQSQTATGLIFGTPFYMSPEQCAGEKVDQRSDIYSLGCALFEILTGRPPFVGENAFHTFMMHQSEEAPSLASKASGQAFPPALEQAIKKMLNKKAIDRYQTMSQLKHDLERILAGKPILSEGKTTIQPSPGVISKTEDGLLKLRTDNIYKGAVSGLDGDVEKEADKKTTTEVATHFPIKAMASILLIIGLVGGLAFFVWQTNTAKKHLSKEGTVASNKAIKSDLQESKFEDASISDLPITEASQSQLPPSSELYPWKRLQKWGASDRELHSIGVYDIMSLQTVVKEGQDRLRLYLKKPGWLQTPFLQKGVFYFPEEDLIGAIAIGNKPPVRARGAIAASANKEVCLYLFNDTRASIHVLDKFGPNDLTGLSMIYDDSGAVRLGLPIIAQWKRLKDLWLFNPLIKTITVDTENWAESKIAPEDLPVLDTMEQLTGIGLCYPTSGPEILRRHFLHRIEALRLERIKDFRPLLEKFPELENLKEVFLMNQETTNDQLNIIARMKNLRKLTILRGDLTPASANIFARMKSLKELRLDKNTWTPEQQYVFQKKLPGCKVSYEKVIDPTFWPKHIPSQPPQSQP